MSLSHTLMTIFCVFTGCEVLHVRALDRTRVAAATAPVIAADERQATDCQGQYEHHAPELLHKLSPPFAAEDKPLTSYIVS